MDFKSLISKISSMDDPIDLPKAPEKAAPIRLDEDTELRVLAGVTKLTESVIAEKAVSKAKKDKDLPEKKTNEAFDSDAKVGDTKKTTHGTLTKTASGVKHTRDKYEYDPGSDDKDDKKRKEKARKSAKESIDTEQFKAKFSKMVEAKKSEKDDKKSKKEKMEEGSKPDFLDVDKDGDKKEPMKKAAKEAGKGEDKKETKGLSSKQKKLPPGLQKAIAKKKGTKESVESSKKVVSESVEQQLSLKDMLRIVRESGGQQQIDPVDQALWNWANRVAASKITESGEKAEIFAAMVYERNGGRFEMYDVLAEQQK